MDSMIKQENKGKQSDTIKKPLGFKSPLYVHHIDQLKQTEHLWFSVIRVNVNGILIQQGESQLPLFFMDVRLHSLGPRYTRGVKAISSITKSSLSSNKTHQVTLKCSIDAPVPLFQNHLINGRVSLTRCHRLFKTWYEFECNGFVFHWKKTGRLGDFKLVSAHWPKQIIASMSVPVISLKRKLGDLRIISSYSNFQEIILATWCLIRTLENES